MPLKPGALSAEDINFITVNCTKLTAAQIASSINRRVEPVLKFIKEHNLTSLDDLDGMDEEYQTLLMELQKKVFYKELKKQLDDDELKYFTAHWIEFISQFGGDVLASEQMQVKELIIIDILNNRIMQKRLMAMNDINRLTTSINDEYKKPLPQNPPIVLPTERDIGLVASLEGQLGMAKAADSNLTTESTKLSKDKKDLYTALKATRDQRFKTIESGEQTFMKLIKELYNEEVRQRVGEEAELIKKATEKKKDELYDYHKYGDATLDIPILNSESALIKKELQNEEESVLSQG